MAARKKTTRRKSVAKRGSSPHLPAVVPDEAWQQALTEHKGAARQVATTGESLFIGIRQAEFQLEGQTSTEMRVVIVDQAAEHAYYTEQYVEGQYSPPSCWAIGKNLEELAPDPAQVVDNKGKSTAQADDCQSCWANRFGSHPEGRRGKACSQRVRLAILAAPEGATPAGVKLLRVPVTSTKNFSKYIRDELSSHGITEPFGVYTILHLEKHKTNQHELTFEFDGFIEPDHRAAVLSARQAIQKDLLSPPSRDGGDAPKSTGPARKKVVRSQGKTVRKGARRAAGARSKY